MEENKKPTVPYLPFKTLLSVLDQLDSHGMPNQIDRSVFPSQSGVMQGQIMSALRFFDLIDDHGKPTKELEMLASDKDRRKVNLQPLLTDHYDELIKIDLTKASPSQLDQAFDNYGVSGDTKKKAKSFFIKAAQFVGLPLSPLLTRKTRSSGPRKKRNTATKVVLAEDEGNEFHVSTPPPSGMSKTIRLRSGGELTLSLTVNLWNLKGDERDFVFGLIDQIQGYEGNAEPKLKIVE